VAIILAMVYAVLEAEVLIWRIVQQRSMRHSLNQRENDFLA
jgi:hypothetical protein